MLKAGDSLMYVLRVVSVLWSKDELSRYIYKNIHEYT